MSWQAKRYKDPRYNWHHIPPKHPAIAAPAKIRILKADHEAYNRLFGNAANLEQCIEILKRDWWPGRTA